MSILRVYCCVLTAVAVQEISADIINEQQLIVHENKQLLSYQQLAQTAGIRGRRTATSYTQPMHRSILSAKRRRESSQLREDSSRRMPDFNIINEDEPSYQMNNESLLTSPYWVKIHEEYGDNSFNFIPSSRRAASSVVYTYKHYVGNDGTSRVLQKNTTSAVSSASVQVKGTNSTTATNLLKNATSNVSSNVTHNSSSSSTNNTRPESKTINSTANNAQVSEEEYMIISGGYTDRDWETFPVYAFPLTSSIQTLSGQWIDLSPPDISNKACNKENTDAYQSRLFEEAQFLNKNKTILDPWDKAENCAPSGRMGHISVVHNDKLYVFGGLIYDEEQASGGFNRKRETFRLEDVPYVYRLDLKEMFKAREAESKGSSVKQVTGWQRIIPRIKPFSTNDIDSTSSASAAEVLIASINRGEMQGGLWSSDSPEEHDKMIMYGGLRIAKLDYSSPSKFVKGGSTFSSSSQMRSHKTIELPLGDVWGYDLVDNAWEKITNSFGKVSTNCGNNF